MMNSDINLLGLMDASPMCIKLFDGKGNLIFLNKFGMKEHHLSEGDDISKWDWMNTIKKEYQDEVKRKFSEILTGSPVEYVEFEHTPEGSDHLWCSGALSSVKDEKGFITGVLFYSIDVSARKKAEKDEKEKSEEIKKMNAYMVDRELKMIDLKKQIEELKKSSKCNDTKCNLV